MEDQEIDEAIEFDEEASIEKTLANPNHPSYKVILALCALLTVLWTQNGSM